MAVQVRQNFTNRNFIARGNGTHLDNETLAQDAGRAADMVRYTIMSQNPTTRQWVPLTDIAATDGTEKPNGILMETVATADIAAGTVAGKIILTSGTILDEDQAVLENSLTFNSVIATEDLTVRQYMTRGGFQFTAGSAASRAENA